MSPRTGIGFDGRGGGRWSVAKAHPVEGWWVLNSRILFIPSEQQADEPSAGSDASLSQAVLQSIGRGQLGLEDGSPQIRNQPGKTPTRTHSELQLCSPPAVEVEKPSLRVRDVWRGTLTDAPWFSGAGTRLCSSC
ncbi:unnamed protein product [Boreogadus saida]